MMKRVMILGIVLAVAGLAVAGGGFLYGKPQADDGLASAQAMYEAQGITLAYNDEGQLLDRGTVEGAQPILALLVDEWKFPLNEDNLDPADPVVNTRDEVMVQYATITYHVLNTEVAVKLTAEQVPITYRGVTYTEAGEYMIAPLAYYSQLDRTHPIEGQLRAAWSPLALSLLGYLSAGHANQAAGELAQATTLGIGAIGLLFALTGTGLVWVSFARTAPTAQRGRPVMVPGAGQRGRATPPDHFEAGGK